MTLVAHIIGFESNSINLVVRGSHLNSLKHATLNIEIPDKFIRKKLIYCPIIECKDGGDVMVVTSNNLIVIHVGSYRRYFCHKFHLVIAEPMFV